MRAGRRKGKRQHHNIINIMEKSEVNLLPACGALVLEQRLSKRIARRLDVRRDDFVVPYVWAPVSEISELKHTSSRPTIVGIVRLSGYPDL